MKRFLIPFTLAVLTLTGCRPEAQETDADHLVILHTNDTHSGIDPDRHDKGGIARRKVLIDSVRADRGNVILVDAGDAVQGSLYFTIFGGEVERRLMNELGYDIRILGNHEFDRGIEALADQWSQITADRLSANYDFTGTVLEGLFVPTVTKEINGHKVGFIGINLDPIGIIAEENFDGITYHDAIERANDEAARLKEDGAEIIVAVTHIGYEVDSDRCDDIELARKSKDIDVIIGGHSHTVIDPSVGVPSWRIANAAGDTISVLQTGSTGINLGEIDINLVTKEVKARLIPIDSRLDSRIDESFAALITPYREQVDSMKALKIGYSHYQWERASPELLNLMSDFVRARGAEIAGKPVDLAIMNKGGIRNSLNQGDITKGEIIDIAPFNNKIVVMEISGKDILENFGIMAAQEGNGVSSNVRVLFDPSTRQINSATIDGKAVNPEGRYRLATIDYLAAGNDYMTPLTRGVTVAKSKEVVYDALINYLEKGKLEGMLANPDRTDRMTSF